MRILKEKESIKIIKYLDAKKDLTFKIHHI